MGHGIKRNAYILVRKLEGNRPFGISGCKVGIILK
jgi:hypothetical protein